MPRSLQDEQKDFEQQLPELLKEHRGQFVLFQDGKPVDYFPTNEAAYSAGVQKFGTRATFLIAPVAQIGPLPISMAWDFGVMFGR